MDQRARALLLRKWCNENFFSFCDLVWLSLFRSFPCPLIVTVLSQLSYRGEVICGQLLIILSQASELETRLSVSAVNDGSLQKQIANNGVKLVNARRVKGGREKNRWRNNWNEPPRHPHRPIKQSKSATTTRIRLDYEDEEVQENVK